MTSSWQLNLDTFLFGLPPLSTSFNLLRESVIPDLYNVRNFTEAYLVFSKSSWEWFGYSYSHRSKLQSFAHLLLLYIETFTHEGHRTSKSEMQSEFHEMGKALWEEIDELTDTMPPFNLCSVVQEPVLV